MTLIIKENTELVVIPEGQELVALFLGKGLDDLITKIEKRIRSHVPDVSTVAGRKAIASNAYLASRAKVALDNAGKGLTQGWRDKIVKIDTSRRSFRDRLDVLRDEARKPLGDWEA